MNKLLKTFIASVLLCSVSLLGVFASSCKKTNAELPKIEEDVLTKIESGVTDGDGNKLEEDEVYALPQNMVFSTPATLSDNGVSEQGLTSVTVTATLTPSNSTEPVDWSLSFKNASSSWASGKSVTDYVTVTPTSDGSTVATVRNKEAFGEQIILKCSARNNPAVKATCTIDYYAKIKELTVKVGYGNNKSEDDDFIDYDQMIQNEVAFEDIKAYSASNPYKLPDYGYLYGLTFLISGGAGVGTIVEEPLMGFYYNEQGYSLNSVLYSLTGNSNVLGFKTDPNNPSVVALFGLFDYTCAKQANLTDEEIYNMTVTNVEKFRQPSNDIYIPHLFEIYFYVERNNESVALNTFYFEGMPNWSSAWLEV